MELVEGLVKDLSQTPYACSRLDKMNGGMMNFIFRAHLLHPLPDGSKTVIVKHGEDYSSGVPDFSVPTNRCSIEQEMLQLAACSRFQPVVYGEISIRSPHLYHFDAQTNTQMMEDVVSSDRLRDAARNLSPSQATNVGEALGKWLAGFHHWSSSQLDAGLLELLKSNAMIDDLIHEGLDDKIFAHCESVEIRDMARKQLMKTDIEGRGVIYGDLTTKKYTYHVPVQPPLMLTKASILIQIKPGSDRMNVTPIGWEACRLGILMQDVALLIADLFVQHSLEASPAALPLIHGFIRGYGPVKDTLVFQAAVYTGIYLFLWEGGGPYTYEPDQVDGLLQVAVNLVAHSAGEDQEAIKETFLGGFFS